MRQQCVAGNFSGGQVNRVYLNQGDGSFDAGANLSDDAATTRGIALGDFNGDGRLDVVTANDTMANRLYLSNGPASFAPGIDLGAPLTNASSVAVGDLDGVHGPDIVIGNNGANVVYLNNGDGSFSEGVAPVDAHLTLDVALADVDADGDLDLVTADSGYNHYYLNDGSGAFDAGHALGTFQSWTLCAATGDLNGDGRVDLVFGYSDSWADLVYLNNGSSEPFAGVPGLPYSEDRFYASDLALADLDGDGYQDLVSANYAAANRVYFNDHFNSNTYPLEVTVIPVNYPPVAGFGSAIEFDGSDDYVQVPALDLSAGSSLTLEAWIRPSDISTNTYYEILRQNPASGFPDYLLAFQDQGTILSFGLHTTTAYQELDVPINGADFTDGNWHHVAASYDGTSQRLYVDGIEVGNLALSGSPVFGGAAFQGIGASYANTVREFFQGAIDELRIWNIARNADQIRQARYAFPGRDAAGLVALWHFDEGNGLLTRDVSGNRFEGLLSNGPVWISGQTRAIALGEDSSFEGFLSGYLIEAATADFAIVDSGVLGNAVITDATTGAFRYTPDANANGSDSITYKLNDGLSDSATVTVDISIAAVNDAPVTNAAPVISGVAEVGNLLQADTGSWSDVDGDILTYGFQWYRAADQNGANALAIPGATGNDYTVSAADDHRYLRVVVTADDGQGSNDQAAGSAWALVGNWSPVLGGTFVTAGTLDDNATTTPFAGVTVSDADGDDVRVTITFDGANGTLSGAGLNGGSGNYTLGAGPEGGVTSQLKALVFTPTANQVPPGGTVVTGFTLTPSDGRGDGVPNGTTRVTATSINDAPGLSGSPVTTALHDRPYSFQPVATDPDPGETLTFSVNLDPLPGWLSFDPASGALTGIPASADAGTLAGIIVTGTDSGGLSASLPAFDLTVVPAHFPAPQVTGFLSHYQGLFSIKGGDASLGDEVAAYDPDGVLCGHFTVETPGQYGPMHCCLIN